MSLTGNNLSDARHLGFARQLAHTPGITPEQGKAIGTKYASQHKVRAAKFEKIAAAIKGTK